MSKKLCLFYTPYSYSLGHSVAGLRNRIRVFCSDPVKNFCRIRKWSEHQDAKSKFACSIYKSYSTVLIYQLH